MSSIIKVVKRNERKVLEEKARNATKEIKQTTEMIIKNWIAASRERRRVEAESSFQDFKRSQLRPLLES